MFVDKNKKKSIFNILIIVSTISIISFVIFELLMMIKASNTKLSKFVASQFYGIFVIFSIGSVLLIIAMLFMIIYNKIVKMRNKNR